MALQPLDRLWMKSKIDENTGCWLWLGATDGRKGYGRIRFNKKKISTHRLSAHLYLKLDLFDKILRALHKHICPNKNCWNPEHLYIGTDRDNSKDAIESGVLINRKVGSQKNWRKF